jgi:hypothetical protein
MLGTFARLLVCGCSKLEWTDYAFVTGWVMRQRNRLIPPIRSREDGTTLGVAFRAVQVS